MFEELSKELQEARIKNNMTLEQLSAKTRIDVKFIEAIEIGDFAFLPELYVKAFIKQYAKAVNLDEDITVKKYESAKSGVAFKGYPNETENIEKPETTPIIKEKRIIEEPTPPIHTFDAVGSSRPKIKDSLLSEKNRLLFGGIIVAIVFIFAFVYFFFLKKSEDIIVPEKSIEEVISENKDRFTTDKTQNDSLTVKNDNAVISDSLLLTIRANDTSWVKIILDDSKVDEFILFPKSQKIIAAENNYKITFGNSGGIELMLNKKPLNFSGKKGGLKYVLINKSGLEYLRKPPSL